MKKNFVWALIFAICMGVGFLHGVSPQGPRPVIHIAITSPSLFNTEVAKTLEAEFGIQIEIELINHWDELLGKAVANSKIDLFLLPSHWASTLAQQNLLHSLQTDEGELQAKIAPDFFSTKESNHFFFAPLFWQHHSLSLKKNESLLTYLQNLRDEKDPLLFDDDLALKYFENEMLAEADRSLSSLLIWGMAISRFSQQKSLVHKVLLRLLEPQHQLDILRASALRTTLLGITGQELELNRTASSIRNLELQKILTLEKKIPAAEEILKEKYNFTWLK